MAYQNATNQNPGNTQERDKGQAVGAGATGATPDQTTQQHGQGNLGGTSRPNETAGQGGGVQGTGQGQASNPTGATGGQGSERSGNQVAGKESEGEGKY